MDRKWVDHPEHTWLPCVVKDKGGDQATLVSDDGENIKVPAKKFATLASVDEMQLQGVDDVCTLPVVTEGALLHTMRVRYKKQLIYTRVQRILISLNPFQSLPIYANSTLNQYAAANDSMDLPPHIFAIGADALNGLRQGSKDQAVVISGESGAGKTESAKLIMSFVTSGCGSGGGLDEKVLKTNPVLEAFGNARTVRNNNSSRFGKWLDMQFASDLSLLGCHVTHYLLEVTRVCGQADGERSYHIFFQLINARSSPELQELEVQPCSHYKYLENSEEESPGIDDKQCYDESRDAFSTLGFTAADQLDVFRIVAACLTLGNVTFKGADEAEIQDKSVLETIAWYLMVDQAALTKSLLIRKMTIGKDVSEAPLKPEQAKSVRDTLAKQLYGLLFAYLIDKINANLQVAASGKKANRLLGVLDIAGFESFDKNSLEQLCINLSNEHLQQHFNSFIFKSELEDYKKEGIELTDAIEFQDNAECLALIDGKGGVMDLLDEECTVPKGSDQSYVNKVLKAQEKHKRLIKPKFAGKPLYGISHYAGIVNYTCDGWLEKNQNKPPDEAMEVLLTSSSSLVRSLAGMMQDMTKEKAAAPGGKKKKETGTSKFRLSLKSLIEKINKADPHYIRCIKPNKEKQPGIFTAPMVMEQLLLSGSLEAVRIRQQGFATRLPFKAFVLKYRSLGKIHTKKITDDCGRDAKDLVEQVCGAYQKDGVLLKNFAFGTTKVFIRGAQTISALDYFRERVLGKSVVKIQKVFRGNRIRKQMAEAKAIFASVKSWLQTNCPLAMKPPISSSCLQTLGDLKVAGEKIKELSPILNKAKALPYKADCVTWAEGAMKRVGAEMEAMKQMTELLKANSIDPVSLGNSLARANDLGLSFSGSYSMVADRIDKLQVQVPLIEAMKNVVDNWDNTALHEIVANVKAAGLESGGWLPEFDGANLYRQVLEEQQRVIAADQAEAAKAAAATASASPVASPRGMPPPPSSPRGMPPPPPGGSRAPAGNLAVPGGPQNMRRSTMTGLDPAQQDKIIFALLEAQDELDAENLEKYLGEGIKNGIEASQLAEAKDELQKLQTEAYLRQKVAETEQEMEEEDQPASEVVKRLANLSKQMRKLGIDDELAAEAMQRVQVSSRNNAKVEMRKSVFGGGTDAELAIAGMAFSDLSNFKKLKPARAWKGHRGTKALAVPGANQGAEMLYHSKVGIAESLTKLPAASDVAAVENFTNIRMWMGDKTAQEAQRKACKDEILSLARSGSEIRDEIYVQVLKQMTENESPRSIQLGWQLLLELCEAGSPSDELIEFVRFILKSTCDGGDDKDDATIFAKKALCALNGEKFQEKPILDRSGSGNVSLANSQFKGTLEGHERGTWRYICVDPTGVRTRNTPVYVKSSKVGGEIAHGEVVVIDERGKDAGLTWIKLKDGRGWAFEKNNSKVRMSEVQYFDIDEELRQSNVVIRPNITSGLKLMETPHLSDKNPSFACLHPGTPIMIVEKAKVLTQEGFNKGFLKVQDDVGNQGWMPEDLNGKRTYSLYSVEQLVMEGGESCSLWIAVCPGKQAPIYLAPGRSDQPIGYADKCEMLEIAPERIVYDGLNFYRLVAGGWLCETNPDGKVPFEWVQREDHWWTYQVCSASKGGADIRHKPTRDKNCNTGRQLAKGLEVAVCERVVFGDGDAFLRLCDPYDGWVAVTRLNGDKKMAPMRQIPPRDKPAELPSYLDMNRSNTKKSGGGITKGLKKAFTVGRKNQASATE